MNKFNSTQIKVWYTSAHYKIIKHSCQISAQIESNLAESMSILNIDLQNKISIKLFISDTF